MQVPRACRELLLLLLLHPAAAPGPAYKGGLGETPCWYCGASCYVRCSWSVYRPAFVEHLIPVELIQPTNFGTCGMNPPVCVTQPPLSIGPNDELVVQGEALLFSTSGGKTWSRQAPNPSGPAHCPWKFCGHPGLAGVGWLRGNPQR